MNIEDVFIIEELLNNILNYCTYLDKHNLYLTCKNLRKKDKRTICTDYYIPTYSNQSINYYKELHNKTYHLNKLILFFDNNKDNFHIFNLAKLQINILIIKGSNFPKIYFPKKLEYLDAVSYPYIIKNIHCNRAKVSYINKHFIGICSNVEIIHARGPDAHIIVFFENKKLIKIKINHWIPDLIYYINRNYAFEELAELEVYDHFIYSNFKLSTELISKVVSKLFINTHIQRGTQMPVFINTNNNLIELYCSLNPEKSYYNFVTNPSTLIKFITKEEMENKITYYNKTEINSDIYCAIYNNVCGLPKITPNITIKELVSNIEIYKSIKEQGGNIIKYTCGYTIKPTFGTIDYYIDCLALRNTDYDILPHAKFDTNFNNVGTLELDWVKKIHITKDNKIYVNDFPWFVCAKILILKKNKIQLLQDDSKNIVILYN